MMHYCIVRDQRVKRLLFVSVSLRHGGSVVAGHVDRINKRSHSPEDGRSIGTPPRSHSPDSATQDDHRWVVSYIDEGHITSPLMTE